MAQEELGRLSAEQIQKFAKTLSEIRSLASQLSEITDIALDGEEKISARRKANQKEYFDAYSKNLNLIYAQTEQDAAKLGKARASQINSDEKAIEQIRQDLLKKRLKLELEARKKNNGKLHEDDAIAIEKQLANEFRSRTKNQQELDRARRKYFEQELRDFELISLGSIDSRLADAIKTYETKINSLSAELASAENQDPELQAYRQKEASLKELTKTLTAEIEAQNLLNTFNAESAFANTPEAGEYRSREAMAKADAAAINELNKQKADFRAKLDAEAIANNGGILSPEDAAKNAKRVEEQFVRVEDRLAAIRENNAIRAVNDPELAKLIEKNEKNKAKAAAKYEMEERKRNGGKLTAEQKQEIKDKTDREFALTKENLDKLAKRSTIISDITLSQIDSKISPSSLVGKVIHGIADSSEKLIGDDPTYEKEHTKAGDNTAKAVAVLDTAVHALSSLAAKLDNSIDRIASYQGFIDTRLQGSNSNSTNYAGSYWGQLTKDMMSVGAVTPFFKQENFANNIKTLVEKGISFDLKQRAFLMTIQEKIANTFDVADGTLLRLIRIQQADTTAGRLGMESALNSFLNNMYETSEYLSDVAKSVRTSLQEMESLMSGTEAAEVEYQVQKWMGSLYSVGMSQEAVNNIATAIGQIAAGQIDALTSGSGAGNLIVMAANEAGKSISEILTTGLNAEETNNLLQATVNYLAELAESSKDSRVIQQQLAGVFGVKASDLKAATNLATGSTSSDIYGQQLSYDNMLGQLNMMAGTMYQRTGIGEMIQNVLANGEYTLASSMANNPIAYIIYKMAGLLESTTGGLPLPAISVFGNMVDLHTSVADLMRVGSMAGGIFDSIGSIISGLGSSFDGQAMLSTMGIGSGSGLSVTPRGNGGGLAALALDGAMKGGITTSGSGYVGNSSGSDIKNSTLQSAEDSKEQQMIEAKEGAEATQIDFINTNVLKIYELLDEVTSGKRNFNVKVAGYGLTNLGSNTSLSGAQGGVAGLLSNSPASNGAFTTSSSSNSSSSSYSNDGFSSSSGIDLGGWTIM